MYMRLIHAKYKPKALTKIRQIFDETVIPKLQKTPGCLFVGLTVSETHNDEGFAMSLWETQAHAEAYEKSGLYQKFLEKIKPHLAESSEWKIQLSEEMTLEYQPVPEEPVIKSYASLAQTGEQLPQGKTPLMYLRVVSVKIRPGKMEEFRKIYTEEIIPVLHKVKGCRYAYLSESTEEKDEVLCITIWDNKQDVDDFEGNGLFAELKGKVEHTFSSLYQWKMALEKESGGHVVTSEDLSLGTYSIVTGKSFK